MQSSRPRILGLTVLTVPSDCRAVSNDEGWPAGRFHPLPTERQGARGSDVSHTIGSFARKRLPMHDIEFALGVQPASKRPRWSSAALRAIRARTCGRRCCGRMMTSIPKLPTLNRLSVAKLHCGAWSIAPRQQRPKDGNSAHRQVNWLSADDVVHEVMKRKL